MAANIKETTTSINIQTTSSALTVANRWHHLMAHMSIRRDKRRVNPGLYALGTPNEKSPVFVTANYVLSFDALRSALTGIDCYILVLNTFGINVWCAAGKGTFGTDELANRIAATKLHEVVRRRKLILPQLGGSGVAAHEVKKRTGFSVEFGPVRAKDLPEYLTISKATPAMRRVQFTLRDRLLLVPVEFIQFLLPLLLVAVIVYFTAGTRAAVGAVSAILAGVVLFPILLPWIPTHNFSTKGFILGGIVALPFFLITLLANPEFELWQRVGFALAYLLALPPVTAFIALNFTGATTFTSRSGVKREMFAYIPVMAWMFGAGIILSIICTVLWS